jgi:hemolysin activation/secretion protein
VQLRALLQPGTTFGLTDVQLAVTEAPADILQVFYDNQGVQSTGRYEAGVYYRHSGALGFDDRFTFYGTRADGNLNGNVSYNIPINTWGGRIGASYTQGRIKIIQGSFQTLDITGQSRAAGVNFSQPLFVTDAWLLQANLADTYSISQSDLSQVRITDDRSNKQTLGVSLTNSGSDYSLTVSPAVNFVQYHSEVTDIDRPLTIYSGTWNALVRLPANFSISALGSAQYTTAKLLPGDQLFQIGGPTTVRGFPTNTAAGDSGVYANFELHNNLSKVVPGLDIFGFIDQGEVASTFPAHTVLRSAGAGLSYTPWSPLTIEASVGMPWQQVAPDQPKYQAYFRVVFRPLLLAAQ